MFKAPTQTPNICTLLDDLLTRDAAKVARHLGVTKNTVKRWAKTGNAPRMAHLALFWETRWGLSVLDADIWNRESLRLGMIDALERENARLVAQLARLVALGHHGAANDAVYSDCERTQTPGAMAKRAPGQWQLQPPGLVLVSM